MGKWGIKQKLNSGASSNDEVTSQGSTTAPSSVSSNSDTKSLAKINKRLNLRRKLELKIVQKYDKDTLGNKEVWFIIDTRWLNKWANFLEGGEQPGPISNKDLLNEEGVPLSHLQPKIDYRGVCPMVYYILREFHEKDNSSEIIRYECDIHGLHVVEKDFIHTNCVIQPMAISHARKICAKWLSSKTSVNKEEDNTQVCVYKFTCLIHCTCTKVAPTKQLKGKEVKFEEAEYMLINNSTPKDAEVIIFDLPGNN